MKVLVTGACGFLGSYVVRALLARGDQVLAFDALTYAGCTENLPDGHGDSLEFVSGDVADPVAVAAAFSAFNPDAIIHMAAETHVDRSLADPAPFLRTNVIGTQVVLDAARAATVGKIVHVSTDEVYGDAADLPAGRRFVESDPLRPSSPYSASKAAAEHLCRAAMRSWCAPVVILRPSNCYGARQFPEKLIPLAVARIEAGKTVPVYGDGLQRREWLHAEDMARGVVAALEHAVSGEAYNLGGGADRTNLDVVLHVLQVMGEPASRIEYVTDRAGHDRRYAVDSTAAWEGLGWRPREPFSRGLADTVERLMKETKSETKA